MNFVNIPLVENVDAPPLNQVQIPNPKFINDDDWEMLHEWVHDWFLQRIPAKHQHLVSDVKEGDVAGLLVKVFGLAARNPMEYCKTIKLKMKKNTLTVENFDLVAHQWILDQYEMFGTINDADCIGEYKMAPTDFVDHIIDTVEEYLPTLARSYRDSVIDGRTWDADRLKTNLDHLAGRGQLRVENDARKKLTTSTSSKRALKTVT